ncbi:MAG: hypothetical protein QM831_05695 [Kofleriaceae bacterium]
MKRRRQAPVFARGARRVHGTVGTAQHSTQPRHAHADTDPMKRMWVAVFIAWAATNSFSAPRTGDQALADALAVFNAPDANDHRDRGFALLVEACTLGNHHACEDVVDIPSRRVDDPDVLHAFEQLSKFCKQGDALSCRVASSRVLSSEGPDTSTLEHGCNAGYEADCFALEGLARESADHAKRLARLLAAAAKRCDYGVPNACIFDQRSNPTNLTRLKRACAIDRYFCETYDKVRSQPSP